ncbi:MAG TPA: peptidoglycan editing factor PgeF [Acidobacteriaceae bacterium]|nr:peptidoglycan editing factor PgeF [Acidobacteriaceae bacterium]
MEILRVPGWAPEADPEVAWLVHGFSTRTGGQTTVYRPESQRGFDLNLGFTADDAPEIVTANRRLFCKAVGRQTDDLSLFTLKQIHSSLAHRVWDREQPVALKGDGLMTSAPGVLLGIQTADCLPVMIVDRRNRAVAIFHAGWRGTLARIVENGLGRMRVEFGSRPEDLAAAIGPGIGPCCYSVGEEVRGQFQSQFCYWEDLFHETPVSDPVRENYPLLFLRARPPGHPGAGPALHLNLAEANRRQLLAAGLSATAIYMTGDCTSCQTERFFSHRKEQGFTGRMMSVIGIRF